MIKVYCSKDPNQFNFPVWPNIQTAWDNSKQVKAAIELVEKSKTEDLEVVTWSEAMVNRICLAIYKDEADNSDFQFIVDGEIAFCDDHGFLQNWPYGWFLPRED